uniref:Uncharacterized protein n=1 Tax=Fagus sylvatica TaxID=28930 RepID=A0A2N9I512_FAGSY
MAQKPSTEPKVQRGEESPAHLVIKFSLPREGVLKYFENERENGLGIIFPPHLARCSRHGKYPEEDDPPQHQPKPRKCGKAGPPHHPVVHGELSSGPQQTQSLKNDLRRHQLWPMTKRVTKRMRQGTKDTRKLMALPKSVPSEMGNDEKPTGYFLYLLVTVDLGTKASTAAPAGTKMIIKAKKT